MKKQFAIEFAGACIAVLAAGCAPELAQVNSGADEKSWSEFVRSSYSGYQPPRTTAPAEADKYRDAQNQGGAQNDPAAAALPAEDKTEAAPAAAGENTIDLSGATPTAAPAVSSAEKKNINEPLRDEDAGEGAVIYQVKPGDTLSSISLKFYKTATKDALIYKVNAKQLKNPNRLTPGMKLVIPQM